MLAFAVVGIMAMSNYRLYCFDRARRIVCRDDFDADNRAEARAIARAICDACSDEHYSYELWKDDLPIESGVTLASVLRVGGLSDRARQTVLAHEIALKNSSWAVSRSRRLGERIAFEF